MSRRQLLVLLATAVTAAGLAAWKMVRPAHGRHIAVTERQAMAPAPVPRAGKAHADGGRGRDIDHRRQALPPNVDESPWPESSCSAPAQDPPPMEGAPSPRGNREELLDLKGVRQDLRSIDSKHGRREAFRRMLADGESGAAAALAVYWSSQPDDPWVRDFLATIRTSAPHFLAGWLADSAERVPAPAVRTRLLELLGELQGPAAVEAVTSAVVGTSDPEARRDLLALLARRNVASEVDVLAEALLIEDPEVSASAARGLASIGGARAYAPLLAVTGDPENADTIVDALGAAPSPFGQSALIDLATDSSQPASVRTASVLSLSQSRSGRVLTVLENTSVVAAEPVVAAAVQVAVAALREACEVDETSVDTVGLVHEDERWF